MNQNMTEMVIGGTRAFWVTKRAFDLLFSVALLPLLFAGGTTIFVLNLIFNRGTLILRQTRVGLNGETFVMYKFRTMYSPRYIGRASDREQQRTPPLGRFLKRYWLDEAPQLVNVIAGHMSLIGPRPEQPSFAAEFSKSLSGYDQRHRIRPGLTGLAQVEGGYIVDRAGSYRKLALDLRYVRRAGFQMDGVVLWRTFMMFLPNPSRGHRKKV
ncbi:MAG: sugar transferase [Sulfitobacter sp.]